MGVGKRTEQLSTHPGLWEAQSDQNNLANLLNVMELQDQNVSFSFSDAGIFFAKFLISCLLQVKRGRL